MKGKFLIIAVAGFSIMGITSCKKNKDNDISSRAAQLVGTWNETTVGADINTNGMWDANEKQVVPTAEQLRIVFNSNGTGTVSQSYMGVSYSGTTTWQLRNNESEVRLIITALGITDTVNLSILSFTPGEFSAKHPDATPAEFSLFKKQ